MPLSSRPPLEGTLRDFAEHYCEVVDRFGKLCPLLVQGDRPTRRVRHTADQFATSVRVTLRHAVRLGDPEPEAPTVLWKALRRAHSILEYVETVHVMGRNQVGTYSDVQYARLARKLSENELEELLDILATPDPDPGEGELPAGMSFEISDAGEEAEEEGKLRRLLRQAVGFKDKGLGRWTQQFKAILLPALFLALQQLGVEAGDIGKDQKSLLDIIDKAIEAGRVVGLGGDEGTCEIDVELKKFEVSDDSVGEEWRLVFVIEGEEVTVEDDQLVLNDDLEKVFEQPLHLTEITKKGCKSHDIEIIMEAQETEYFGPYDVATTRTKPPISIPCHGESDPDDETISIRVGEMEIFGEDTNQRTTVTATLGFDSHCKR